MPRILPAWGCAALAFLATAPVAFAGGTPYATQSYDYQAVENTPSVTTFTAAAPQLQPYVPPPAATPYPYVDPVPVAAPVSRKGGYYNASRYGGNAEFGYSQSHACGGVLDGEHCLVILNDHMRRVRLDRPAGTILVGNPLIADVTVLGKDTLFVSARSIGSTNIIVLDKDSNEIVTYEVFVREPRTKRVTLNNGGQAENYQCAPFCERALTQSDSSGPHSLTAGQISTDIGLDTTAISLQSGANPNEQGAAQGSAASGPAPSSTTYSTGATSAAASGAPTGSAAGIASQVGAMNEAMAPGLNLLQSLGGIGGGGASPAAIQPVRTDAPPLLN